MKDILKSWLDEYFGSEETVLLAIMLMVAVIVVVMLGGILGPVFAALVITYILQGIVNKLRNIGISKNLAIVTTYIIFLVTLLSIAVWAAPIIGRQMSVLLSDVPEIVGQLQGLLKGLPDQFSEYITAEQFNLIWIRASTEIGRFAEQLLSLSINSFPGLVALLIYFFLVPLLVFFMLKDQKVLIALVVDLLPTERSVMNAIWAEMDLQVANYIRGKAIEILVVGIVSLIAFLALDP